jgi:hypothetical protein
MKSRAEKQRLNPEIAFNTFKKANLGPLEPYKNTGHRWLSKCLKCGKRVRPTYDHVEARGAGLLITALVWLAGRIQVAILRGLSAYFLMKGLAQQKAINA